MVPTTPGIGDRTPTSTEARETSPRTTWEAGPLVAEDYHHNRNQTSYLVITRLILLLCFMKFKHKKLQYRRQGNYYLSRPDKFLDTTDYLTFLTN